MTIRLTAWLLTAAALLGLTARAIADDEPMRPTIAAEITSGQAPRQLASRASFFFGPDEKDQTGARGIRLTAPDGALASGTSWRFSYSSRGPCRPIQIVHPFGKGHLVITLSRSVVRLTRGGDWNAFRYSGRSNDVAAILDEDFTSAELTPGIAYRIESSITPTGEYQLLVDDRPVAWALVRDVHPLTFNGAMRKGPRLVELQPVDAALIVGPVGAEAQTRLTDVTLAAVAAPTRIAPPARDISIDGTWTLAFRDKSRTVELQRLDDHFYRLAAPATVFEGTYLWSADQLLLVETKGQYTGFVWQFRDDEKLELTVTRYKGAALTRRGSSTAENAP